MSRWDIAQEHEKAWWGEEFSKIQLKGIITQYSGLIPVFESKMNMTDDWKILDVGCGPTCASLLFRKGEKYGIDPLMDDYAKTCVLPKGISLMKGVGENIPFPDGFFNLVISRNALDHMEDPEKVMKEIKRVVKRGGYVILSVYVYTPFVTGIHKFVERHVKCLREEEHPHFFTAEDIQALCKRNGFSVVSEHHLGDPYFAKPAPKPRKIVLKELPKKVFFKLVYVPFWKAVKLCNSVLGNKWQCGDYVIFAKS